MDDNNPNKDGYSLEDTGIPENSVSPVTPEPTIPAATSLPTTESTDQDIEKRTTNRRIRELLSHVNIYVLFSLLILLIAAIIIFVGYQNSKKATTSTEINSQSLSQESLSKISANESKVGDPKSTLTIESNSVFSGKVLIKDALDVAGNLRLGGALSLPRIAVSGNGTFDSVQANTLALSGNANVQGTLNVQRTLAVSGGANFGGPISAPQITTQSLQFTGDIQIIRHIDAGGGTPGKTNGSALGSGGTATVSGTDTAGTITINIGSGAPASGCFVNITFATKFNATPHIVVTPVGASAAALNYYIDRSSTGFSLCNTGVVPSGSFSFDYVAID